MLRWFCLAAFVAAISPCAAATPQPYFPPEYATLGFMCPPDESAERKPVQFLSDQEQRWFSQHLRAAHEASLYASAQKRPGGKELRFTWLRSFHPMVTVHISEGKDGRWHLVAKQLSGTGGYEPGTIAKMVDRPLLASEAAEVEAVVARADLPDLLGDCAIGVDGAQWIIERSDEKGYHFINRFSPSRGPIRQVGLLLLKLTRWHIKPVY